MHRRHVENIVRKKLISDRVLAVDIKVAVDRIIRVIAIYVPHAGYTWAEFLEVFDAIGALVLEAQHRNMSVILGGDFNLSLAVGDRGDCMADLCAQFRLQVANGDGNNDDDANERPG